MTNPIKTNDHRDHKATKTENNVKQAHSESNLHKNGSSVKNDSAKNEYGKHAGSKDLSNKESKTGKETNTNDKW